MITSINDPTQAGKEFNQIEDWQTLVVADLKTPLDWQIEGAKILTVEDQKSLHLKWQRCFLGIIVLEKI